MKTFQTPFQFVGGKVATTSDAAAVMRQKIIDVLTTGKFERPMRPDYGAAINQLLFENVNELTHADFVTDAKLDLVAGISGITIVDLKVVQDPIELTTATVIVHFRTPMSATQTLTFQVTADLTEESLF